MHSMTPLEAALELSDMKNRSLRVTERSEGVRQAVQFTRNHISATFDGRPKIAARVKAD